MIRIIGYGMSGLVLEQELQVIEDLNLENGVDTAICLCPFAHPPAIQSLAASGYKIDGVDNVYVKVITEEDARDVEKGDSGTSTT